MHWHNKHALPSRVDYELIIYKKNVKSRGLNKIFKTQMLKKPIKFQKTHAYQQPANDGCNCANMTK